MPTVDHQIKQAFKNGTWMAYDGFNPIDPAMLRVNQHSINVSLQNTLLEMRPKRPRLTFKALFSRRWWRPYVDLHDPESFRTVEHNCGGGFVLRPGAFYLGAVVQRFETNVPLPITHGLDLDGEPTGYSVTMPTYFYQTIDGRSTAARAGLSIHQTCGQGDWGFDGAFTLEITVAMPLMVRAGDFVAQVYFWPLTGKPETSYSGAYAGQQKPRVPSLSRERIRGGR